MMKVMKRKREIVRWSNGMFSDYLNGCLRFALWMAELRFLYEVLFLKLCDIVE